MYPPPRPLAARVACLSLLADASSRGHAPSSQAVIHEFLSYALITDSCFTAPAAVEICKEEVSQAVPDSLRTDNRCCLVHCCLWHTTLTDGQEDLRFGVSVLVSDFGAGRV